MTLKDKIKEKHIPTFGYITEEMLDTCMDEYARIKCNQQRVMCHLAWARAERDQNAEAVAVLNAQLPEDL